MADIGRADRMLKNTLNRRLQDICRSEGLPISGIKSQLQKRILDRLNEHVRNGFTTHAQQLMLEICGPNQAPASSPSYGTYNPSPTYPHSSVRTPSQQHPGQESFSYSSPASTFMPRHGHSRILFRDDPFHKIKEAKSAQIEMPGGFTYILRLAGGSADNEKAMMTNRNTVTTRVVLHEPLASQIAADRFNGKHRIMVYCGNDFRHPAPHIAFPQQCEIKVNGELFSGNLRGLKKKAGTTHPADITPLLRCRPADYHNEVTVTYAATDKKYAMILNLVEKVSAEDLVQQIGSHHLNKYHVISDMKKEADDPDIVATSRVMSLSCPIGGGRIKTPVRTTQCSHNQCFDAYNFFLAQMQAPQWECPVCYKPAQMNTLVVDEYFDDILMRTQSSSALNVTVHPNGEWEDKTPKKKEPERPQKQVQAIALDDSDEDNASGAAVKPEPLPTPTGMLSHSPFDSSRTSSSSNKRPAPQVIDLTLSDDDDQEPVAKTPRLASSLTWNFSSRSNGVSSHTSSKQNDQRSYSGNDGRGYSSGGLPTRTTPSSYDNGSQIQQGRTLPPPISSPYSPPSNQQQMRSVHGRRDWDWEDDHSAAPFGYTPSYQR